MRFNALSNKFQANTKLQIRRDFQDNTDNFFYILGWKHVVTTYYNALGKAVLMSHYNICFSGEIVKIIPKSSLLPILILSNDIVNFQTGSIWNQINLF